MDRRQRLYVADMLEYCEKALRFAANRSASDLQDDDLFRLAILHAVQTIGEAAKAVNEDVRALAPEIPWRAIAKTRDILVHHYFGVRHDIVWRLLTEELPTLKSELELLLRQLDRSASE